jgi:hypothetical protein
MSARLPRFTRIRLIREILNHIPEDRIALTAVVLGRSERDAAKRQEGQYFISPTGAVVGTGQGHQVRHPERHVWISGTAFLTHLDHLEDEDLILILDSLGEVEDGTGGVVDLRTLRTAEALPAYFAQCLSEQPDTALLVEDAFSF